MTDLAELPPIDSLVLQRRRERVFLVMAGLFLGTLTMLNLLGITRFLVLGSISAADGYGAPVWYVPWSWAPSVGSPGYWTFAVAVGVLPYPLTFLCTDLISEFFGRRRANFVVWVGLILNIWVIFMLWVGGLLPGFVENSAPGGYPPPPEWSAAKGAWQETGWTFYQIRFLTFGAVFASMVAYLAAQFIDVQLFHFWKWLTKGKALWLRNNGSTLVSQMVDTFAVITITHFYAHALPVDDAAAIWPQLWLFIVTGYVFKMFAALVDTPIIYGCVWVLRRYLRLDPVKMHESDAADGGVAPMFADDGG